MANEGRPRRATGPTRQWSLLCYHLIRILGLRRPKEDNQRSTDRRWEHPNPLLRIYPLLRLSIAGAAQPRPATGLACAAACPPSPSALRYRLCSCRLPTLVVCPALPAAGRRLHTIAVCPPVARPPRSLSSAAVVEPPLMASSGSTAGGTSWGHAPLLDCPDCHVPLIRIQSK